MLQQLPHAAGGGGLPGGGPRAGASNGSYPLPRAAGLPPSTTTAAHWSPRPSQSISEELLALAHVDKEEDKATPAKPPSFSPAPPLPPLRRPAAHPEHQEGQPEAAAVRAAATPGKLAQLSQQLRMRVRAVQDLVARCPKLLTLTPEQLDDALASLAADLAIPTTRAAFMVSKSPQLLFVGRDTHPQGQGSSSSSSVNSHSSSTRSAGRHRRGGSSNSASSSNGTGADALIRGPSRGETSPPPPSPSTAASATRRQSVPCLQPLGSMPSWSSGDHAGRLCCTDTGVLGSSRPPLSLHPLQPSSSSSSSSSGSGDAVASSGTSNTCGTAPIGAPSANGHLPSSNNGSSSSSSSVRGGTSSSNSSSSSSTPQARLAAWKARTQAMKPPPSQQPSERAATLAALLNVPLPEVVHLATSAPSVLSRPPVPMAAKLQRLSAVLGGASMVRVLRMAAEEPSYLTHRPPAVDRRIQAMCVLFRRPRQRVVEVLKQQPDLVFMSPRILQNKLKVLQSILNKEARLVVPIAMRTPKLLRTDMDQVRDCYEMLEGLMGLPNRSYTFAMVCHAPSLLLEGRSRLVGRFRCIASALRVAPNWAKQWARLYPAQRADCMLVTPVTYSRLDFLIATGQASSLRLYDTLMMARSDFDQRFPNYRPIPIRRPTPTHPAPFPAAAPTATAAAAAAAAAAATAGNGRAIPLGSPASVPSSMRPPTATTVPAPGLAQGPQHTTPHANGVGTHHAGHNGSLASSSTSIHTARHPAAPVSPHITLSPLRAVPSTAYPPPPSGSNGTPAAGVATTAAAQSSRGTATVAPVSANSRPAGTHLTAAAHLAAPPPPLPSSSAPPAPATAAATAAATQAGLSFRGSQQGSAGQPTRSNPAASAAPSHPPAAAATPQQQQQQQQQQVTGPHTAAPQTHQQQQQQQRQQQHNRSPQRVLSAHACPPSQPPDAAHTQQHPQASTHHTFETPSPITAPQQQQQQHAQAPQPALAASTHHAAHPHVVLHPPPTPPPPSSATHPPPPSPDVSGLSPPSAPIELSPALGSPALGASNTNHRSPQPELSFSVAAANAHAQPRSHRQQQRQQQQQQEQQDRGAGGASRVARDGREAADRGRGVKAVPGSGRGRGTRSSNNGKGMEERSGIFGGSPHGAALPLAAAAPQ